jgi:hypothetical protein
MSYMSDVITILEKAGHRISSVYTETFHDLGEETEDMIKALQPTGYIILRVCPKETETIIG